MLDVSLVALAGSFATGAAMPEAFILYPDSSTVRDQLFAMVAFAAFVPLEAICLSVFGSTLGKALYGIKLVAPDARISFVQALNRSAKVWFRGIGLAVPIVSLYTLVTAYLRLKENGRTSWDAEGNWSVVHSQLDMARWTGIVACWAVVLALVVHRAVGFG